MQLEKEDDIKRVIERLLERLEREDADWLQELVMLLDLSPSRYSKEAERIREKIRKEMRVEALALSPPQHIETIGTWGSEKEELLKTHPGWFVAYQDGRRVALEPSLDRLIAALDKKLGKPRKPCEFHEIVERPPVRRGPSPRLWPTRTSEIERG